MSQIDPPAVRAAQTCALISDRLHDLREQERETVAAPLRSVLGASCAQLPAREVGAAAARLIDECREALGRERAEVARLTGLLAQASEAVHVMPPVATPQALGVRSEPGLQQRLIDAARAQVEAAVSPLRGLITGGDALEDRALVAAVVRLLTSRGSQIDTAHRLLTEAGVADSDGQVPRPLASRLRALIMERDTLRAGPAGLTSDLPSQGVTL